MENFAWKENEAESIKHDPVRSLSYAFLDLYPQLQRSTICQSFSYSIMIYIIMYILTSNSTVPPKKGGVWYPLVGNLLHQVTFFSHLTVPSSHCALPTSHMTVLFSHLVVLLLFSHVWRFHPHIMQFQHHIWQFFSHIWWFSYFFLTFDDFILIL